MTSTKRYGDLDWKALCEGQQLLLEKANIEIARQKHIITALQSKLSSLVEEMNERDLEHEKVRAEVLEIEEAQKRKVDSMPVSTFLDEHKIFKSDISAFEYTKHYAQPAYRELYPDGIPYCNLSRAGGSVLVPMPALDLSLRNYRRDEEQDCVSGATPSPFKPVENG